jgi:hypothetical protein
MLIPVTPTQEYERLHQSFGWGKKQFLQCSLKAFHAAFGPETGQTATHRPAA